MVEIGVNTNFLCLCLNYLRAKLLLLRLVFYIIDSCEVCIMSVKTGRNYSVIVWCNKLNA